MASRLFGVAAVILFLVTMPLCILFVAYVLIRIAAFIGLPGSITILLAVSTPAAVPILLVTALSRWASRRDAVRLRSGWLVRLDPAQPTDAEIEAAAGVALAHFEGDTGRAIVWARAEAIRFFELGDLRRNLIAVRMKRALEGFGRPLQ